MSMHGFIHASKARMISKLPVSISRKYFQAIGPRYPSEGSVKRERQLLVDVSVIFNNDARTGIQRVVRALLLQLLQHPPVGCKVRPVYATRKHGYRYVPEQLGLPWEHVGNVSDSASVSISKEDIFLGLDLAAHVLPLHLAELAQWKRSGAEIHIIVYDLLPVLHPQWFNAKTSHNFRRWLRTIAIFADSAICISNTVKNDLANWMYRKYGIAADTLPITTIPLGADIQSSVPSCGLPKNIDEILSVLATQPTVLMVGTLEPRKGHLEVLSAFEKLWLQGHKVNLVIVGKPGWKTEALQQAIRTHANTEINLYWLDNASDELLELLYGISTGVIVASQAEGFGLPLIEAMHHNKPVLARDIPVLREIGGAGVSFFTNSESLTKELEAWLGRITTEQASHNPPQHTWQDSATALLTCLALGKNVNTALDEPVRHAMAHEVVA